MIYYDSKKLKENENNYTTRELDLVTILHALKMWINYLIGKKFELRKNHIGFKYLFGKQNLNVRKIRLLEFLTEYDFDIKHIE
jgi:hypothetical protein